MKVFLKICDRYPVLWNQFIGKIVIKNNKEIGKITEVKLVGKSKQFIIGDGDRIVIRQWFEDGSFNLKEKYIDSTFINSMPKEVIMCKAGISSTIYELSILNRKLEGLNNRDRDNYMKKLLKIVRKDKYKNHCYKCGGDIDSANNEFCVKCGWYKCNCCQNCACNSMFENYIYKSILINNSEASILKDRIEFIDYNKDRLNKEYEYITNKNIQYNNKLKQLVKDIKFIGTITKR